MIEEECKICKKMTKEKYKHYKSWKITAIVFICLSVLFAVLFFSSGNLFTSTDIEHNNKVDIENSGDYNTNTDNGNIIIKKQNDNEGAIILLSAIVLTGGILGGCYIVSQVSHKNKQSRND